MAIIINRTLSIALAGESKTGKSHLGALIVKRYGGVFCDFSRVNQVGGMDGTTVKYNICSNVKQDGENIIMNVGEAYTAVKKVGLDLNNYKLISNWTDFENAIAYAKVVSDDILHKKIWLILDDSVAMRWHKAMEVKDRLGHKSILKKDWGIAAGELNSIVRTLSTDFNLFIINQMSDEYTEVSETDDKGNIIKEKQKTGIRSPWWIPNGLDYLVDAMVHIEIDKSTKPAKQYLVIDGGREVWICDENFEERVTNITPELIMKVLGITEDRL